MKHESIEIIRCCHPSYTVVISIGGLVRNWRLFQIQGTVEKVMGFTLTDCLSNWVVT